MRTSNLLLLVLLLAASATLLLVEPSDARTIIVDDDWGGADYDTIRAAIAAASDGDTIRVYDGTYNEANNVGKSLNLIGNGTSTIIDGHKKDHVFGFDLHGGNTNVSGFYFYYWRPTHHYGGVGVYSDWNRVFNNTFYYNNRGIFLEGCKDNLIHNNTFDKNYYSILVYNGADRCNVSFNAFTRDYASSIHWSQSSGGEIFSNTFETYTNRAMSVDRCVNFTTSFNMFEVNDTNSGYPYGVSEHKSVDSVVHNNTLIGHRKAILARGTTNLRIENNAIYGGVEGLFFDRTWWNRTKTGPYCTNTVVRNNNIQGQSRFGINATGNMLASIDARYNWWDDVTGPYHLTNNTGGKGTVATDLVDFDPWLDGRVVLTPIARIHEVRPGLATEGETVTFLGRGLARNRTSLHVWRSSIDGELCSGPDKSFSLQDLSVGNHTIRLVVKDRDGLWSEGVITTLVVNGRPRAVIDAISPSASNEGEEVRFEGSYSDHEDDVTTLVWESDVDGMLSSMGAFTTGRLSNGTHNITFRVRDGHGAWSEMARATVTVNGVPRAWIESIEPDLANEARTVIFRGGYLDHEGKLAVFSWHSDIDGTISDTGMFYTSSLSNGTHDITFTVKDRQGVWSRDATGTVTINGLPRAMIGTIEPSLATEGETVRFIGDYIDHEGRVDACEWRSDIDGVLIFRKDFNTSSLTAGAHLISFTVRDHMGVWAEPATALLVVNGLPQAFIDFLGPDLVNEGEFVTFIGRSEDPEEYVSEVVWESDIDGILATVHEFSSSTLSPGTHTITLRAMDGPGAWSKEARATVTVNGLPSATIVGIEPSWANEGEAIEFTGAYLDFEDDLVHCEWTSDLDGLLSDQWSFASSSLSNGTHIISLRVKDRQGTWSPPDSAILSVNGIPRVTILPTVPERVIWGDVVTFEAEASDDGTIIEYHWTSSLDGAISERLSCSRKVLSVGHHTIALRVKDDAGEWSLEARIELIVEALPVELAIEDIQFVSPVLVGEEVSFVSHVRNVGMGDVTGITVRLRLDGEVASAIVWDDSLAPEVSLEARFDLMAVSGEHMVVVEVLQGDVVIVSTVSDTNLVVDTIPAQPTEDGGGGDPGAVYRLSEPPLVHPLVHLLVLALGVVLASVVYAASLLGGRSFIRDGRGNRPQ